MEESDKNFRIVSKINTLEEALQQFSRPSLLEELDRKLELVRKNKEETKEKHGIFLKSIDKELLKLSRIYHPDKGIKENKSDEEVSNADNMQIALNATRTVLKALTEVFLKDIDVHYKYEFFAKLNINTLINEKQINLEINNVLCRISRLSEIKRVNIVGEIRNFLLKCRNCLESFIRDNKSDFVRHRENAFYHLQKCIEGYEILLVECKLIVEECSAEGDENTRRAIEKIREQSEREYDILRNLEITAQRSLHGTFEIFPPHGLKCSRSMTSMEYIVPKELEYFVSPFIIYINVLLMCSVMFDKKSHWIKIITKVGEVFDYLIGVQSDAPVTFSEEPTLLKAYHLASYSNNKNYYKEETRRILQEKGHSRIESSSIREVFKETVKEIEQLLAQRFDIDSYKEGKSNRERFNERLLELNDSVTEFKEVGNDLLEKFKLYEQETKEIRKEYSKLCENAEKTEEEFRKSIPKCESAIEKINKISCDQSEYAGNGMFNENNVPEKEKESCAVVKDNYMYELETMEIRKEYSELCENAEKTEEEFEKIIPKYENTIEQINKISCDQSAFTGNRMFNENNIPEKENESCAVVKDNYMYDQETMEIRKEYSELCENAEKTEEEFEKIIHKCENTIEKINKILCGQSEIAGNGMLNENNVPEKENESCAVVKDNYMYEQETMEIRKEYSKL